MAVSATATKIGNLVDPQVIGSMIDKKLINAIKFAPLAEVHADLVGRPGDTVSLPSYGYIGQAVTVTEGTDIPIKQLTATTTPVKVSKVGIGVELTDEAVLSGYGDPLGQSVYQIAKSIADKVDDDLVTALDGNQTNVVTLSAAFKPDDVADALVKFGEDVDEAGQVIVVDAAGYATLRKSTGWIPGTELGANIIMNGVVGSIYGCQVVVSDRVSTDYYIVRPGALAIYLKRDTMVETDRDIVAKSTVITADKHFASYLADPSKAIKITL